MEMFSPPEVDKVLWHAKQRSEVWKRSWSIRSCANSFEVEAQTKIRTAATSVRLPALTQSSVEPIPQRVERELGVRVVRVFDRVPDADVDAHVLPRAQRDLELRHDVPVGSRSGFKLTIRNHLDHRRPEPAKATTLRNALPDG